MVKTKITPTRDEKLMESIEELLNVWFLKFKNEIKTEVSKTIRSELAVRRRLRPRVAPASPISMFSDDDSPSVSQTVVYPLSPQDNHAVIVGSCTCDTCNLLRIQESKK